MALTHITPEVIDLPKVTVALINDATPGGIRSYIDAPNITPAHFDSSTATATTEFVRTNGFAFPKLGGVDLTTNTTLTLAQTGRWFEVNADNITITLPQISSAGVTGATYTFACAGNCTLKASGTDTVSDAGYPAGGGTATRKCIAGETVTVVANSGIGWYIIANGFGSDRFTTSQTANGYQKLPGGTIIQWGTDLTVTGKRDTVTYPIAFPNIALSVVVCEANTLGWESVPIPQLTTYGIGSKTATNFMLSCIITASGSYHYAVGAMYNWVAIGY